MYDPYIGMYYLQSRYYNPAYGRFLNVDDTDILEASQGTTHGANLFAYCNNNPVMNVDYGGKFPTTLFIALLLIMAVYLIRESNSSFAVLPEAIVKFKIGKIVDNYPRLVKLYSLWGKVDLGSSITKEYWLVFSLFAAHSKNIVDSGTKQNFKPEYPEYYLICPNGMDYTQRCKNAYELAIEYTTLKKGVKWENMTPQEQFVFVHEMYTIDEKMYNSLYLFSLKKLLVWGSNTVIGFFFGIADVFGC